MKPIYLTVVGLAALIQCSLASKLIDETINLTRNQEIFINLKFADKVNVIPISGNKVSIKGEVEVNGGESDEAYSIEIDESDHRLNVESKLIEKPKHYRIVTIVNENGDIKTSNHTIDIRATFDVFIPTGRTLHLKSINASMNLKDQEAPLTVETINGEIDLQLPKDADIDLVAKTVHGECYTNLDFQRLDTKNGLERIGGNRAKARLNKGGTPIHLKTINGYMYVRELSEEDEG